MSSRCQSPSSVVSNGSSASSDERSTSSSRCRRSTRSSNTPSIESLVTTQRRSAVSSPSSLQSGSGVGQSRVPPIGPFDGSSQGVEGSPGHHSASDPSWLVSIRNLNRTGSPLRPSNLHLIQELQRRNVSQSGLANHNSHRNHYAGSSRPSYQRVLSNTARSCTSHQMSQRSLRLNDNEALKVPAFYGSRSRGGALDASDHSAAADARIAAQRSKLLAQQQLTSYEAAMRQSTVKRAPPPPTRYQRRESLSSVDNTSIYSQHSHPSPPPPPPPPPLPPMPENIGRLERGLYQYQERSQAALRPGAYHHCPAPPPLPVRQLTLGRSNHSRSGPPMFGYEGHSDAPQSRYATYQSTVAYASSRSIGLDTPSQHGRTNAHTGFRHQTFPDRYRQASASDQYQPSTNQNPDELKVEISPNVWVRLRGADETWACVEQDFFMPVVCFGCASELCCIQDADFVLCPTCRVVSPMNGIVDAATSDGGVGLGFTFDDLMKWQSDIVRTRQQQQQQPQQQQPPRPQQPPRSRLGLLTS